MTANSRPIYETSDDLSREREVALKLAKNYKLEAIKLPKMYPVDWALCQGSAISSFIEIKCRKNQKNKYSTLILSLHKWQAMMEFERIAKIRTLLVVEFIDALACIRANSMFQVMIGGRDDRNDPQDKEPVIHIPIKAMKNIILKDGL